MAIKDSFTAADWGRVVGAPMLAGIAVTAAEPGGLCGALRESMAAAGALRTGDRRRQPADQGGRSPPTRPPRGATWRVAC